MIKAWALVLVAVTVVGCKPGYIKASKLEQDEQGPSACRRSCGELGMRMTALVLVGDELPGCVCQPLVRQEQEPLVPATAPTTPPPSAPPSPGAAPPPSAPPSPGAAPPPSAPLSVNAPESGAAAATTGYVVVAAAAAARQAQARQAHELRAQRSAAPYLTHP